MKKNIKFNKEDFYKIIDTLERNGYSVPGVIGPVFNIYPQLTMHVDFINSVEPPPVGYPYEMVVPGTIGLDQSGIPGHCLRPAPCAYIDSDKNYIGFNNDLFPVSDAIQAHYHIINHILSENMG